MYCKVCGAQLQDDQAFCAYCGTKAESTETIAETEANVIQPAPETPDSDSTVTTYEQTAPEASYSDSTYQDSTVATYEQATSETTSEEDKAALTGFILGIVSSVLCCIGLPTGIIGIIKSAKGLRSRSRKVMAILGLILSIVSINFFLSFWTGVLSGIFEYSFMYNGLDYESLTFFLK